MNHKIIDIITIVIESYFQEALAFSGRTDVRIMLEGYSCCGDNQKVMHKGRITVIFDKCAKYTVPNVQRLRDTNQEHMSINIVPTRYGFYFLFAMTNENLMGFRCDLHTVTTALKEGFPEETEEKDGGAASSATSSKPRK